MCRELEKAVCVAACGRVARGWCLLERAWAGPGKGERGYCGWGTWCQELMEEVAGAMGHFASNLQQVILWLAVYGCKGTSTLRTVWAGDRMGIFVSLGLLRPQRALMVGGSDIAQGLLVEFPWY